MVLLFFTTWTRTLEISVIRVIASGIAVWKSNDDCPQNYSRRDLKSGHHGTFKRRLKDSHPLESALEAE